MSKNSLDKLFGSKTRVKILKFTFRNYPVDFSVGELARKIQEPVNLVKQEVFNLIEIGLIRKKK